MSVSSWRKKLKTFLNNNPWSEVREYKDDDSAENDDSPSIAIMKPWNEDSVVLVPTRLRDDAIRRLNSVTLYPSFSGIYHRRRKSLELIYTPYKQRELDGRQFGFSFEGHTLNCHFSAPSEVLFDLALANEPLGPPTDTNYRNLRQFRRFLSLRDKQGEDALFQNHYKPISFWIEECYFDEQKLVELAQHLNFYMDYFDSSSPIINIHEVHPQSASLPARQRYLWDSFPSEIAARRLDPYLLSQMSSAKNAGDVYRRFLYYYQIIEYAAFYYLSDKSVRRVEAILKSPETPSFPKVAWQRLQDILADEKMQDAAKMEAVVNECVDASIVWKEIEPLRELFEAKTTFEGGFVVRPCLTKTTDLENFKCSGLKELMTTLRSIRNALVHAREQRMANVISPTRENYQKLIPFVRPLALIAKSLVVSTEPDQE